MELNEFRVGNLVMHPLFDTPAPIKAIAYNGLYIGDASKGCPLHLSVFEPLKLTEKWIRDLGGYRFLGWDDMVFWRFDEFSPNIFELMELNGTGETKYEAPSGAIIEYVHTLQNAYYFHVLTGKELTLKEEKNDKTENA
jgi:hypothetical protein